MNFSSGDALRTICFFCILLFSSPVAAEVTERIAYTTYPVNHQEGRSLLQSLNKSSPIRYKGNVFHAYTSWNVHLRYRWYEEADGSCRLTHNVTTLTAEISLPELQTLQGAADKEFSRYVENLRLHEHGHRDIGRKAAKRIDEMVLQLPAMPSCPILEKRAEELRTRILEEAMQEERSYDQATQYGRTQGAWLPR